MMGVLPRGRHITRRFLRGQGEPIVISHCLPADKVDVLRTGLTV